MNWKWPESLPKWKGALGKYQGVLLVIVVGVLLLLLPTGGGASSQEKIPPSAAEAPFDLEEFEQRLEGTLSEIQGAGKVRVVLTLDSSSRQVLAQDVEREADGGGSSTVVTVGSGAGNQEVVALQTVAPKFRGALVVCPGGGQAQTKLRLLEAVSALTGLSADRISICEGNS